MASLKVLYFESKGSLNTGNTDVSLYTMEPGVKNIAF